MQYIVLDMEWNQAWPGSSAARAMPGLHGEIIQIGAVRLLEDQTVADEFQILVRPRFFRRLNKMISTLTGIKEARLKAEGVPFPEAVARFQDWCGGEAVFLAWGFDDAGIMRDNLRVHRLPDDWTARWYNAQMIFNAQTDGSSSQRALNTAMEMLDIPTSRPAHDALGDAYHTALICAKLNLERGIEEYRKAVKNHEDGFHGAELEGCVQRKVIHGYMNRADALTRLGGEENLCPLCGAQMEAGHWIAQRGQRYMNLSICREHGKFLVRIRLQAEADTLRASRLLYDENSQMFKTYEPQLSTPPKRSRRRRKKKPAPHSEP